MRRRSLNPILPRASVTAHRANLTGCICRDLNDGVTCNRRGCWGSFSNVHGSCGILATDVFYSTAAFIRCKVFCRSETNLPFLHKRKRGKKSVDAIWLLFTVTLSTVRTGGGGCLRKLSPSQNHWLFSPINLELCGGKEGESFSRDWFFLATFVKTRRFPHLFLLS